MPTEAGESSSSKRYAAPEDWANLQDVIVRLYVEENKTLEEVRQHMEENHDFIATISMYKRQLASWNAFKNLRFDEVLQILRLKRQREAEHNRGSDFFVRDRKVEIDSLQIYISRNPSLYSKLESGEEPHSDAVRDVSCRTPAPLESPSDSPEKQNNLVQEKAPEAMLGPRSGLHTSLIQLLRTYISEGFHSGTWVRSASYCWSFKGHRGPAELLKSVLDRCMTAALSVGRQVEPAAIRHALDSPFSLLIRVFKNPPPEMIPRILCVATRLELIGRGEIQGILLQFCSDLARALYGPDHSLSNFWQTLIEVPHAERSRAIVAVLAECVSEFEEHLGAGHTLSTEIYLLYFDAVERQKDPKTQAESIEFRLSKLDEQNTDRSVLAMLKFEHALATCKADLADGKPDKADNVLSQLDATTLSPRDNSFRCVWLGYIRWMRGETTAAEKAYKDSVQAAKLTGSRDCVCEALFQLETFYLHIQEPLQAEGVRAERLNALRKLGAIAWVDQGTTLGKDSETSSKVTIIRIGSDASSETWDASASTIMIEYHDIYNQVATGG
ncbi:hypothetical protein F5B22DRAFT_351078 [Xylaria bambusicola]|uniref:uncharacterized protein n=1 Tax=Xylaria bambusicola TaxID=326684 RepID=UPI002007651A|nr:uncharacterized protein F5B22DRAFT_351078 [Xylaria bambusicola]KAI0525600.1 hypothetical protein F5B22DRAFT_351078 [Xylaria bambusicola]